MCTEWECRWKKDVKWKSKNFVEGKASRNVWSHTPIVWGIRKALPLMNRAGRITFIVNRGQHLPLFHAVYRCVCDVSFHRKFAISFPVGNATHWQSWKFLKKNATFDRGWGRNIAFRLAFNSRISGTKCTCVNSVVHSYLVISPASEPSRCVWNISTSVVARTITGTTLLFFVRVQLWSSNFLEKSHQEVTWGHQ